MTRGVLQIAIVFLLGLVACSGGDEPKATAAGAPVKPAPPNSEWNVVFFSIDTLRADALGTYGNTRKTSPTIDALAAESIVFERAITQAGVTSPSHMTMLTSLYPSVHRVGNVDVVLEQAKQSGDARRIARLQLNPRVQTLAAVLRNAGFATAAFTGGGNVAGEIGFARGFDVFDDTAANGMNGNAGPLFDSTRAREWIAANSSKRFFLLLHTFIPHGPYVPPAPWNREFNPGYRGKIISDRAELDLAVPEGGSKRNFHFWSTANPRDPADLEHLQALYHGEVRYADDAVKEIVDALRAAGVWEKTLFVLVSDHGEQFLEHGQFEHFGGLWEELAHVPFVLRVPGRASARIAEPVGTIDVMPTLLDLLGLGSPEQVQGRSLKPALDGRSEPRPIFSETVLAWNNIDRPDKPKTPARMVRAVRLGTWTYLRNHTPTGITEELYDRSNDPKEQKNLAQHPDHARRLGELRGLLDRHVQECDELTVRYGADSQVELTPETIEELKQLGYVK
ncbi:MAG: sulfatase-like hydrolase/transferase [Planctomycetes bacterium]|nr:sulfatase-like hydrolase/transferase [Planctomycetota bacterium]